MTTHRPRMIACDAINHFGAVQSGIGGWCWADFPTRGHAERFALFCALEGYGVHISTRFADRNRVSVNPDWRS